MRRSFPFSFLGLHPSVILRILTVPNQYLHKVVDTLDSSWRGRGIESEACGGLGRLLRRGTREGPRDVVQKKGRVATDGTWTARLVEATPDFSRCKGRLGGLAKTRGRLEKVVSGKNISIGVSSYRVGRDARSP